MKPLRLLLGLFAISAVVARPTLFRRSPLGDSDDEPAEPLGLGSYVGVKAKHYEGVTKDNRKGPPHPGVVIGMSRDKLKVAMISNNHPLNPPQIPIANLHPQSNLQGNVNLHAKVVDRSKVKYPWQGAVGHMPPRVVDHLAHFADNPTMVPPHLLAHSPSTLPPHPVANGPTYHSAHPIPPKPRGGGEHHAISNTQSKVQAPLHHSLPPRPIVPRGPNSGPSRRPSPPSNSRGPNPYDPSRRPVHGMAPQSSVPSPFVYHPNNSHPPVFHPPRNPAPAQHRPKPISRNT